LSCNPTVGASCRGRSLRWTALLPSAASFLRLRRRCFLDPCECHPRAFPAILSCLHAPAQAQPLPVSRSAPSLMPPWCLCSCVHRAVRATDERLHLLAQVDLFLFMLAGQVTHTLAATSDVVASVSLLFSPTSRASACCVCALPTCFPVWLACRIAPLVLAACWHARESRVQRSQLLTLSWLRRSRSSCRARPSTTRATC
jgi:hypothetical protein